MRTVPSPMPSRQPWGNGPPQVSSPSPAVSRWFLVEPRRRWIAAFEDVGRLRDRGYGAVQVWIDGRLADEIVFEVPSVMSM